MVFMFLSVTFLDQTSHKIADVSTLKATCVIGLKVKCMDINNHYLSIISKLFL